MTQKGFASVGILIAALIVLGGVGAYVAVQEYGSAQMGSDAAPGGDPGIRPDGQDTIDPDATVSSDDQTDPSPWVQPTPIDIGLRSPIVVRGEMACLSKRGSGAQTLECAIGLSGTDGNDYALKNLFAADPNYEFSTDGMRVEVSGTLTSEVPRGPDGNYYDVAGTIEVTSITKI